MQNSDVMQFGFKSKSGCSHALYAVRKTVEFFIERESTVNLCALDMSKAFDKMNRHALFIKLSQVSQHFRMLVYEELCMCQMRR